MNQPSQIEQAFALAKRNGYAFGLNAFTADAWIDYLNRCARFGAEPVTRTEWNARNGVKGAA